MSYFGFVKKVCLSFVMAFVKQVLSYLSAMLLSLLITILRVVLSSSIDLLRLLSILSLGLSYELVLWSNYFCGSVFCLLSLFVCICLPGHELPGVYFFAFCMLLRFSYTLSLCQDIEPNCCRDIAVGGFTVQYQI